MRQILKNVKEKLVSKYQKNTNSKKTKRFKSRIKARIRKNRQSISKNIASRLAKNIIDQLY